MTLRASCNSPQQQQQQDWGLLDLGVSLRVKKVRVFKALSFQAVGYHIRLIQLELLASGGKKKLVRSDWDRFLSHSQREREKSRFGRGVSSLLVLNPPQILLIQELQGDYEFWRIHRFFRYQVIRPLIEDFEKYENYEKWHNFQNQISHPLICTSPKFPACRG